MFLCAGPPAKRTYVCTARQQKSAKRTCEGAFVPKQSHESVKGPTDARGYTPPWLETFLRSSPPGLAYLVRLLFPTFFLTCGRRTPRRPSSSCCSRRCCRRGGCPGLRVCLVLGHLARQHSVRRENHVCPAQLSGGPAAETATACAIDERVRERGVQVLLTSPSKARTHTNRPPRQAACVLVLTDHMRLEISSREAQEKKKVERKRAWPLQRAQPTLDTNVPAAMGDYRAVHRATSQDESKQARPQSNKNKQVKPAT